MDGGVWEWESSESKTFALCRPFWKFVRLRWSASMGVAHPSPGPDPDPGQDFMCRHLASIFFSFYFQPLFRVARKTFALIFADLLANWCYTLLIDHYLFYCCYMWRKAKPARVVRVNERKRKQRQFLWSAWDLEEAKAFHRSDNRAAQQIFQLLLPSHRDQPNNIISQTILNCQLCNFLFLSSH